MKLQIDRIDQHELTAFINRVKLIDSFVYMKISNGQINSAVYLPQRDAVKSHNIPCDKIFQVSEFPDTDKEMKIAFFEGSKVIEAIKHFDHDAIKGEIEFLENDTEFVASTLRIFNDELEITLSCSEPSLGFKDLTEDQQAAIFATNDTKFSFTMDTHTINKVKNLFGVSNMIFPSGVLPITIPVINEFIFEFTEILEVAVIGLFESEFVAVFQLDFVLNI